MHKQNKKVSIIIPCYNGERLLHNSLDSILLQTYRNLQILLIDDGSTDGTKTLADTYSTKFAGANLEFRYFFKENGGAASAINVGIQNYSGDYFFWFDSDDILEPEAIEEYVVFLQNNPQYDYCMGEGVTVQEGNTDVILSSIKRIPPKNETKEIMLRDLILGINTVYGPGTVMCTRQLFERAIPKEGIYESREGQNWQLLIPITYYGTRGYLRKTTFRCVTHQDSHSRKRRSADSIINREWEFIHLCTTTIDNIPEMPQDEKQHYHNLIRLVHLKNIYRLCLRYLRIKSAVHVAKEIKSLGCTGLRYKNIIFGYIAFIREKLF